MTPFNVFRRQLAVRRPLEVTQGLVVWPEDGSTIQNGTLYDNEGLAVPQVEAQLTIMASVQPASGKVMQALPENRRDIETYSLFTNAPLATGDIVEINSADYEIHAVESWQNNVINHNQYVAQRVMA